MFDSMTSGLAILLYPLRTVSPRSPSADTVVGHLCPHTYCTRAIIIPWAFIFSSHSPGGGLLFERGLYSREGFIFSTGGHSYTIEFFSQ